MSFRNFVAVEPKRSQKNGAQKVKQNANQNLRDTLNARWRQKMATQKANLDAKWKQKLDEQKEKCKDKLAQQKKDCDEAKENIRQRHRDAKERKRSRFWQRKYDNGHHWARQYM